MEAHRAGGTRFAVRKHNRIAYDPGAPAPGATAVVVFLHDLLADRSAFADVTADLAQSARAIVPDARGHGASATLANQWYTVAELAQDVLAVLAAEEAVAVAVARAHLVGHGLGGVVALELALRAPERVASLTLIEPALYGLLDNDADPRAMHLREERRAIDRAAADAAYKGLTDRALELYLAPRHGEGWRERIGRRRQAAIRRHAGALAGLLPALDGYAVLKTELAALDTPTTLLIGEDAPAIDRLITDRLARLVPRATVASIALTDRLEAPSAAAPGAELAALIRAQLAAGAG